MRSTSIYEIFEKYPDEKSAARFFEESRWPKHICCPRCDSKNIARVKNAKPMPLRCRTCRNYFSVRTGTIMEKSKIPLHLWLLALYLLLTFKKGVSSVTMGKLLGIRQDSAWSLGRRIRAAMVSDDEMLSGTVEIDEVYVGGKEGSKHRRKKLGVRSGTRGKQTVIGMRQRNGEIRALLLDNMRIETALGAVRANVAPGSTVYTDALPTYKGMEEYAHAAVSHQKGEYVRGDVHTNSIESFWAVLKRGYCAVYHFMSPKHLGLYVKEFVYRFNVGNDNRIETLAKIVPRMVGKRLTYADLVK